MSQLGNAYSQSQAIRGAADYESTAANTNARWAELQGEGATKRGEYESQRLLQQARQLIGDQRVAAAAQGVDVNTGSVADAQLQAAELSAADAAQIRNNAFLEALGYRSQASSLRSQGRLAKAAGRTASRSSLLSGGLGFLRTAAQTGHMANELSNGRRVAPESAFDPYEPMPEASFPHLR